MPPEVRDVEFPQAGVTGSCELPKMGPGSSTQGFSLGFLLSYIEERMKKHSGNPWASQHLSVTFFGLSEALSGINRLVASERNPYC